MFFKSSRKRSFTPAAVTDAVPQALAHGAEEAASRVSDAAQVASARVAKGAATVSKTVRKPTHEALLNAQLAKTSRELARGASDLRSAVDALTATMKANRKTAATGRTRLIAGAGVGAVLVYHLDPDSGKQRRAALLSRVRGSVASR